MTDTLADEVEGRDPDEKSGKPARPLGRAMANAGFAATRIALRRVSDLLVPPLCLVCRTPVAEHGSLCPACWRQIHFIRPPLCDRLGIPLTVDLGTPSFSAAALADPPAYDRARAVAHFDFVMRDLVHAVKYNDHLEPVRLLGGLMTLAGAELFERAEVIVPVPLNRWKLWARRFNQAALLARELGRRTGLPVDSGALVRVRNTPSQVGRSRVERRRNVRGAFAVTPAGEKRLKGRGVLLVDDVITTGATVEACAVALKAAGASSVDVLALAMVAIPGEV